MKMITDALRNVLLSAVDLHDGQDHSAPMLSMSRKQLERCLDQLWAIGDEHDVIGHIDDLPASEDGDSFHELRVWTSAGGIRRPQAGDQRLRIGETIAPTRYYVVRGLRVLPIPVDRLY